MGASLVGAPIWDLYELVKDHSPDHFGVAMDIGHTTVEGGMCWPTHANLMEPYLRAIYVKDFQWKDRNVEWIPLGEGRIDPEFFAWLQKSDFSGPVSLHVEYLDHAGVPEHVKALRGDIATLKDWLQ